jgi:hypothetical protein
VEYIRRKAFGFRDEFSSMDQAEEYLYGVVDQLNSTPRQQTSKTSSELFDHEKKELWDVTSLFLLFHRTVKSR